MKMYKVKDQEEAVKNAKLFYETVKLAWGFLDVWLNLIMLNF